ncbi:MAG: hypothetical protein PHE83_04070 [Opitutaceae bacterium]|nr:hypothetical protein [Opitutaceae bacterium]
MNTRTSSRWIRLFAKLLRYVSLLVLPAFTVAVASRLRPTAGWPKPAPPPYLPTVGPLPLRFQQSPPPDVSTRPPPAAPPRPAVIAEIATANAVAVRPEPVPVQPAPVTSPAKSPAKEPALLLPDDTKPSAARPEDVLPFFQFPGPDHPAEAAPAEPSNSDSNRLPKSSAVYRQR